METTGIIKRGRGGSLPRECNVRIKIHWDEMMQMVANPWCWACGLGDQDRPDDWFGPWIIERAHVVNKPRREDRRAVVLLCPLCHKGGCHGERFVLDGVRIERPRLHVEHLMWIKLHRDEIFYDRNFLQTSSVKILPLPRKPPIFYLNAYQDRRRTNTA